MFGKSFVFLIFFIFFTAEINSQEFSINKIEPPNWWAGMKYNDIQLMVYGDNLDGAAVSSNNPNFNITGVDYAENNHYLFISVNLKPNLSPGKYELLFEKSGERKKIFYAVKQREVSAESHKGFSDKDVIYLITPDRFSNGNPANDFMEGQADNIPVDDLNGRHGGDLQGIINHLDYIKNLGFTAIWVTPVLENNMRMSYHGYAITDLYKVDPRFGSNELYKKFAAEAHKRGMKVILDHVSNHIGINHYWISELPFGDWINGSVKNLVITNHNKESMTDPHGDSLTYEISVDGWFTDYMPDLNQRNKYLSKYLIQNTIWWMEYAGIDGIREDTYPYSDRKYTSLWAEKILNEYPNTNIVGEVWKGLPSMLAVNQTGSKLADVIDSHLPSVTDFATLDAIRGYLSGKNGLYKIYETFAEDFLYPNPKNLLVFADNHDVARAMYMADGNIGKYMQAITLVLTTRGIPQIYYGSELGIKGFDHHGSIRANFPGGFPQDSVDAFTPEGRNEMQNQIFDNLHSLLTLRMRHPALSGGKFIQYPPNDGIYFYFKFAPGDSLLVLLNGSQENKTIEISSLNEKNSFINIYSLNRLFPSNNNIKIEKEIILKPFSSSIYKVN